jgi:hypothetical protein
MNNSKLWYIIVMQIGRIRVRPRSFVVGDLVLRLKQDGHGKLESPWVGPYVVIEVIPGGSYRL